MPYRTSCVVLLFLLLATLAPQSGAQDNRKCMKKQNREDIKSGHKGTSDYVIAYNITSEQTGQTCGDYLDFLQFYNKENGTIVYKINGTTYTDNIVVRDDNGTEYVTYVNNPDYRMNFYVEFTEHSIAVAYYCTGNIEHIWVTYRKGPYDYTKEAAAKARELTDNPEKYRLDPNGCL